jgi:hypothetical protein
METFFLLIYADTLQVSECCRISKQRILGILRPETPGVTVKVIFAEIPL